MKIKVVSVKAEDNARAVSDIRTQLRSFDSEAPNFLMVYFSSVSEVEELRQAFVSAFPDTVIAGIPAKEGCFSRSLFRHITIRHRLSAVPARLSVPVCR